MKNYDYTERIVRRVFGRETKAIYPKDHSRIKGLICDFKREYVLCSNYPQWTRDLAIMWRGTSNWEIICANNPDYQWIIVGLGISRILAGLEDEQAQMEAEIESMEIQIKEQYVEIASLKAYIKTLKTRLQKLKHVKLQNIFCNR